MPPKLADCLNVFLDNKLTNRIDFGPPLGDAPGCIPVITADGIAESYFEEYPCERRNPQSRHPDSPDFKPPYPTFFLEMQRPARRRLKDGSFGSARKLPKRWGWLFVA